MKPAARWLLIACAALVLQQLCVAQMGMGMRPPDITGVFNPTVGSGSSYEMVKKEGGEKTTFDMAVVDKDSSGGYWIEYGFQSPQMHGTVYSKTLLVRQKDDIVIQRMIMQIPGHPPMDMSTMMSMKGMQSAKERADFRADAENLGTESVTTPAGTFECQHWRSKKDGNDIWISDKVSPWKLVKMTGPNNSMTLVRVITDAKSHITGTPVSMEEMMKQRMGQQ
ncbi:MAG TPA: hypothetical protein VLW06_04110 [Terriglobales bacterium]|nr:hypothetical protein [Terriglobales bacterium]